MLLRLTLGMTAFVGVWLGAACTLPFGGQTSALAAVTTLSVFSELVQVATPATASLRTGREGETVKEGDRVVTGPDGRALLTFFEGSTLVLEPDTEFVLRRLEGQGNDRQINLELAAGKFWGRVSDAVSPSSEFRVTAGASVALVRGTLIGGRRDPDGTFVCWVLEGRVEMTAAGVPVIITADQESVVQPGQAPTAPRQRSAASSLLRVRGNSPVFLRVLDPLGRSVGHAAPGIEVNHILNSITGGPFDEPLVIDIPDPVDGEYRVIVEGRAPGGAFRVAVESAADGRSYFQQEIAGQIQPGALQVADLRLNGAAGSAQLSGFRSLDGPPPGRVFLRPSEVGQAAPAATAVVQGARLAASPVPTLRLGPRPEGTPVGY